MGKIEFFKESIKNLKTVGTVTRSSKYLCKTAIKPVNFKKAKTLVELGAGDGVISKHILKKMRPDANLLAFEINSRFCNMMRQIDDDRLYVVEDSAEYIEKYLKRVGATKADYIISALPFVALPKEVGKVIVKACYDNLTRGGLFMQVHYSLAIKGLYTSVFDDVDVNFVPLNVPPAFVLVCEKK